MWKAARAAGKGEVAGRDGSGGGDDGPSTDPPPSPFLKGGNALVGGLKATEGKGRTRGRDDHWLFFFTTAMKLGCLRHNGWMWLFGRQLR